MMPQLATSTQCNEDKSEGLKNKDRSDKVNIIRGTRWNFGNLSNINRYSASQLVKVTDKQQRLVPLVAVAFVSTVMCIVAVMVFLFGSVCRIDQARCAAESQSEIPSYQVCGSGMFSLPRVQTSGGNNR